MTREPPIAVRRQLRKEVGYGCPISGCNNPYLEWHHFDPPWREKQHHDPAGMIALCSLHHPHADGGAYTVEQLRQLKQAALDKTKVVSGEFQWRRNHIVVYAGGGHYYETYEILNIQGTSVLWLSRDEEGNILVNMRYVSKQPITEHRFQMQENFWIAHGNAADLNCPPSGKLIHAKYANDDEFKVEFVEIKDREAMLKRYPKGNPEIGNLPFPITAVEIVYRVPGSGLDIGLSKAKIPGFVMQGHLARNCGTVFEIG